jgi:hypothetical protein
MTKVLTRLLLLLALCPSGAVALPPSPANCSVMPADSSNGVVVVIPRDPGQGIDSYHSQTITVRDSNNTPITGSEVVIVLHPSVRVCTTNDPHGFTDSSGVAGIVLRAGGCLEDVPDAVRIYADGVLIRTYSTVRSPDFDGVSGDGKVDLADVVVFIPALRLDLGGCTDYNGDGHTYQPEVVTFAQAVGFCLQCTLAPQKVAVYRQASSVGPTSE